MWYSKIVSRLLMCSLIAVACVSLTTSFGALAAIGIWAAAIAVVCVGTALLMHHQKPGRITPINYIAGIVLPWGFAIGRGKLLPIVIESWLRWLLVGVAVIVLRTHTHGVIVAVLLFASWMIDGAVLLRLLTFILTRANANPIAPGTFGPIGGLGALLAASIALVVFGSSAASTSLALTLTGAPIVLFGGGYFLWLGCVLTFGRKARWN